MTGRDEDGGIAGLGSFSPDSQAQLGQQQGVDAFGNPIPQPQQQPHPQQPPPQHHPQQGGHPQSGQQPPPMAQQPPPMPGYQQPPPMAHQPYVAPPMGSGGAHKGSMGVRGPSIGLRGPSLGKGSRKAAKKGMKALGLIFSLVMLGLAGLAVAAVFFLAGEADDIGGAISAVTDAVPSVDVPGGVAVPAGGASTSAGNGKGFFQAKKFKAALASARKEAGPNTRVGLLRVDRGQVWIVCGNEKFSGVIKVTDDGTDVQNTGAPLVSKLMLDDVNPRAPERMIAALKKEGTAFSKVDYASLLDFAGDQRWGMFLKTKGATPAAHYAADGEGRSFRKMSG